MKKYITATSITISLSFALALGVGVLMAQAQAYQPLAPLPGTVDSVTGTTDITTYLSGAIKLIIALGAALSILFAIIAGTRYVAASINPAAKQGALGQLWNSLVGLGIILTSYLLLNSINPALVNVGFTLEPLENINRVDLNSLIVVPSGLTVATGPSAAPCVDCVPINSSILVKNPGSWEGAGGCLAPGPCTVNSELNDKLVSLSRELSQRGIRWQVSEAWPPTRTHKAACQNPGPKAGTCVDVSLLSNRTNENISKFSYSATIVGLTAEYEVPTNERKFEIGNVAGGVVIVVPGITGEHFSVYNK